MSVFNLPGVREVINANGKMTILGASSVSEVVAENMKQALKNFVIIDELIHYTGKVISEKTGAEDGCPTSGAAAGIALSVAAVITGTNLNLIEAMPNVKGVPNEIVIQKGHCVNFGGSITQMIGLGGGVPVEVGCANKTDRDNIECAINERTAALFYTKSHHCVQKGMQPLETMLEIAEKHNLPVIVDAAAEEDLKKYIVLGSHLVIYSGGKALSGPTSGFICGKKALIEACKKQYKGIGRAMKVSKEAMMGLISALEQYNPADNNPDAQKSKMQKLCDQLNPLDGLTCRVVQDEAGREIYRAEIKVDEKATGISASQLNEKLKAGNPAIYIREYYVNVGKIEIDPRPLFEGQESIVAHTIEKYVKEAK